MGAPSCFMHSNREWSAAICTRHPSSRWGEVRGEKFRVCSIDQLSINWRVRTWKRLWASKRGEALKETVFRLSKKYRIFYYGNEVFILYNVGRMDFLFLFELSIIQRDKRNVMRETFRFKFLSEILEFYFIL